MWPRSETTTIQLHGCWRLLPLPQKLNSVSTLLTFTRTRVCMSKTMFNIFNVTWLRSFYFSFFFINSSGIFPFFFPSFAEEKTMSSRKSLAYQLMDRKICVSQPAIRKVVGSNSKLASGSSTGLTGGVLSTT